MRRDKIRLTEDISQQKVTLARQLRLSRHDRDVNNISNPMDTGVIECEDGLVARD